MSSEGQMPIWKNPILEGQRYLNLHLSGDYPTYETIAKKFGVSRARIFQMIALAKNLPDEIIGLFSDSKYLTRLHHITERKLRPLTLMKSNSEKIKAFEKLRGSKTNTSPNELAKGQALPSNRRVYRQQVEVWAGHHRCGESGLRHERR